MEPYSWHLAEVNAAALEPIQNMALHQGNHCAAEYYQIPTNTSLSTLNAE